MVVFRRFYACFSGLTGNLVELNNSARPINVTTRSAVSRKIRERGSGSGRRHARYAHVLFHCNVPEGLHIPTFQESGSSEGTPLRSCVVYRGCPNYYQQFPPHPPEIPSSILKFVKNSCCCQRIRAALSAA